jgi:membrane protein
MADSGLSRHSETSGADPGSSSSPGIGALIQSGVDWFDRELWERDPESSVFVRALRSTAQLIALTVSGFQTDQLLLRASGLTYVTALSIIPMLGVVIAILGVAGVNETIVNFAIDQLTTTAPEVSATVRGYAAGLDLKSFGAVGGTIVFGTAVLALRHLETTLNEIWGVKKNRGWARRFSDYLAVMVVGPISVGVAVSLATTLQSESALARLLNDPTFARIYGLGLSQVPVFVLFLGFTFLYWFFPNTTVRLRAAAFGGLVAAVLFSAARAIYVDFQVGAATYRAVFGALSAVPLILAWLYACWAVVLLGAEVAFATDNLAFARREMRSGEASPARSEAIAVGIAVEIVRCFQHQVGPPTAIWLADELDEPFRLVHRLLDNLERDDLVRRVMLGDEEGVGFVPARPSSDLTLGAILRAVRGPMGPILSTTNRSSQPVAEALERVEGAWSDVADQTSLDSLARRAEEARSADRA